MSDWIEIDADQTEGPVSVAVTRRIKPGCERAYEELVKGIHEAIKGFEGPGTGAPVRLDAGDPNNPVVGDDAGKAEQAEERREAERRTGDQQSDNRADEGRGNGQEDTSALSGACPAATHSTSAVTSRGGG